MVQSSSLGNFQEVFKTAYSHGLENIYTLENVDFSTVRPLQSKTPPASPKPIREHLLKGDIQPCFDFGASYRGCIEPFVLKEPIQVLGLNRYVENNLLSQGKKNLRDLIGLQVSGFGRGHHDEIQQKLHEYLGGRHLDKCYCIDYSAWIRAIVGDLDRKKLVLFLERYNLQHLFTLTTRESMELRRLTLEKRHEWCEEVETVLQEEEKKHQIEVDFCQISEVFVKPWMDKRCGIANQTELEERLQNLSENGTNSGSVMDFFKDVFFKGEFPLNGSLVLIAPELFATERWVANHYDLIIERTLSYFYSPHIIYPFDRLISFLERDFARSWVGFQEGFLQAVLKKCPRFFVHKNMKGILHIRLA